MCVWIDQLPEIGQAVFDAQMMDHELAIATGLQQKMQDGVFVQVCEIHAPRPGCLGMFVEQGQRLKPWFDAMNVHRVWKPLRCSRVEIVMRRIYSRNWQ
jgi:hypothetical protein